MNANQARENEENDLLQNLFDERQRAQELEEELERLQKTSKIAFEISHDQTSKLKQFVHLLKKKYDDATLLHADSQQQVFSFREKCARLGEENSQLAFENEQLKNSLAQEQAELHHVQTLWLETKNHSRETEEELERLKEQLIKLKELLKEREDRNQVLHDENSGHKQRQRQFERVVHYLRKRLDETHLDNKEMSEALQIKEQQIAKVEHKYHESCQQKRFLEEEITHLSLQNQQYQLSKEAADHEGKKAIEKQLVVLEEAKQQFTFLQERIEANLEEYKKEKSLYEADVLKQLHQLQNEMLLKQDAHLKEVQALHPLIAEWQIKVQEVSRLNEGFQEKLNEMANELLDLQGKEQLWLQEKEWLQQAIFEHKTKHEELDSSLKTTQQHLAKKVQEVTILNEEKAALLQSLNEAKSTLEDINFKLLESQNLLEIEYKNQKLLHHQYQSSLKSSEWHALKWEEKYFDAQQKRHEAEERLCEWQLFEEKYQKMNKILNHLSNLLSLPFSLPVEHSQAFDTLGISKIESPTVVDLTDPS